MSHNTASIRRGGNTRKTASVRNIHTMTGAALLAAVPFALAFWKFPVPLPLLCKDRHFDFPALVGDMALCPWAGLANHFVLPPLFERFMPIEVLIAPFSEFIPFIYTRHRASERCAAQPVKRAGYLPGLSAGISQTDPPSPGQGPPMQERGITMTTQDILQILQQDIHSAVFATVDGAGLPQTCVIDLMLADEGGLYFLTARGKSFYDRLMARPFVALSGMKGTDTLSAIAISVRGTVRNIGKERLGEIFEKNPYMAKIYPTEKSREALEVFHISKAEGEYFDLSQLPPYRQSFAFGGEEIRPAGYRVNVDKCIGCQGCRSVCPQGCVSNAVPREIDQSHCIRCGSCFRICPVKAVERLG